MSDEEKEAIEQFKNFIFTYQDVIEDEYSDYEEKECAKEYQEVSEKILNLIEKQSKEIEELKANKGYHLGFIDGGLAKKYEYQDKIKAKIEEVHYKMIGHQDLREAVKQALQSLLEKE